MTASVIVHSDVGFPIDNAPSKTGKGLIWGLYEMTSTENGDWIVLPEFTAIYFVSCKKITTGALTDEAVTIDITTTNKLIFSAGSTDTIRVLVFGTPA